jgi:hypothetical protein
VSSVLLISQDGRVTFYPAMAKKSEKDPHAVHLGRLGGKARIQKLTAEKRREIASKAARARWAKHKKKDDGSG